MKYAVLTFASMLLFGPAKAQTLVWSDDFSNPATWGAWNDGVVNLNWQIGTGLVNTGPNPTSPILSMTAANGYAMLDSDGGPGSPGGPVENCRLESIMLDLSAVVIPILRFQTHYRHAAPGQCLIEISTDGGATWPSSIPLFVGLADQDSTANPFTVELDISSSVAGNPSMVLLRFHWIGPQGYAWFIDDIEIIDGWPVACNSEFIVSQATDGLGQPVPFVLNINYDVTGGTAPFTYLWDFGDGTTSTAPYPTHTYATNGPYDICLTITDDIGCTSTFCDSIMVDVAGLFSRNGFTVHVVPGITTGVGEPDHELNAVVYPNPSNDILQIPAGSLANGRSAVIIDLFGRKVYEVVPDNGVVDVAALPSGQYALSYGGRTHRFVKQ